MGRVDGGEVLSRAVVDDSALRRAQVGEQFFGVGEGLFLGRFQPAEGAQVLDAGGLQGQHHLGQVEPLDLGQFLRRTMRVLFAATRAAGRAPGAVRPARPARWSAEARLIFSIEQRVDAAIRIVARDARQAAVDHQPDAVDGQRGLGDVGGDDDLALVVAGHGGVLVARRQFAVQREQDEAAGLVAAADRLDGLANLEAARHEDQHVALAARARRSRRRPPPPAPRPGACRGSRGWRRYSISTGNVRPCDSSTRQGLRYSSSGAASSVADMTRSLRSGRSVSCRSSARASVMSP